MQYIYIYAIIGLMWSFFLAVIHDNLRKDSEIELATEDYTPLELFIITITWPYWLVFFLKVVLGKETK